MLHRAHRLGWIIVVAAGALLGGCELFSSGPGDGGGTRDAGASDAGPEARWVLGPIARAWEPGQWMALEVENVDVAPEDAALWVLEDDTFFPIFARRRLLPPRPELELSEDDVDAGTPAGALDAGTPDAGSEPATYTFITPVPILREGVFHVAVGTAERPLTRAAEIEVRVPEAPLSREQAGDAMAAGIVGMHAEVDVLLRSEDADWQAFVDASGGRDAITGLSALSADFAAIGDVVREQYMAFPLETEPALRTFLWNTGLLQTFAMYAAGPSTFFPRDSISLTAALVRSPLQGTLFKLDVVGMALGVFGIACDITAIVGAAATSPTGGLGALLGLGPKVAIAALRVILDSFVPTDIDRILEVQTSRRVFEGEGFMVVPWAVFRPQNTTAGGAVRSFEDLALAAIEATVPGPAVSRSEQVRRALRATWQYIRTRLPGLGLDAFFSRVEWRTPRLALPLDLGFYEITLADVVVLAPGLSPLGLVLRLLGDPAAFAPITLTTLSRAGDPSTAFDYGRRSMSIEDVTWPGAAPVERTPGALLVSAFSFGTEGGTIGGAQIVQLPFPYVVDRSTPRLTIQSIPTPGDPSEQLADEDFIILDVDLGGGSQRRWLMQDTTEVRTYPVILNDQASGISPQRPEFLVLVNGMPQYTGPGDVTVSLAFVPGVNELTITALSGHTLTGLRCEGDRPVCLTLRVPDADNPNTLAYLRGEVGATRTFRVWTPPLLPSD